MFYGGRVRVQLITMVLSKIMQGRKPAVEIEEICPITKTLSDSTKLDVLAALLVFSIRTKITSIIYLSTSSVFPEVFCVLKVFLKLLSVVYLRLRNLHNVTKDKILSREMLTVILPITPYSIP